VSDFASALMVRLMAQGMRDLGLTPPPGLEPRATDGARVSLDTKRQVAGAAVQQGGLAALLHLGAGLRHFRSEPMHLALASARGAGDLFARWRRLERYIHSRHRLVVEAVDESPEGGQARLRHTARQGPPPLPAEDLLVLGVLAALLAELGLADVRAALGDAAVLPHGEPAALDAAVRAGATAHWTLSWRGAVARAPVVEGTDALPGSEVARQAAALLTRDMAGPPSVGELAVQMGCSTRALQRALQADGLSYSALLARARCRAAAGWLLNTAASVAEIGYVCGYADQPHFTREFGQRVGVPPAAFRQAFGGS
jgi:AraC-like DNA-binding protein